MTCMTANGDVALIIPAGLQREHRLEDLERRLTEIREEERQKEYAEKQAEALAERRRLEEVQRVERERSESTPFEPLESFCDKGKTRNQRDVASTDWTN